mgnify:FL=1
MDTNNRNIFEEAAKTINPRHPDWVVRAEKILTHLFEEDISAGRLRVFHVLLNTLKKKYGNIYETENVEEKLFYVLHSIIKTQFKKSFQVRAKEVITQVLQMAINYLI